MRASQIRLARVTLGLTQHGAATLAGMSPSRWSMIERELVPVSGVDQRRIARVLKTTAERLFPPAGEVASVSQP